MFIRRVYHIRLPRAAQHIRAEMSPFASQQYAAARERRESAAAHQRASLPENAQLFPFICQPAGTLQSRLPAKSLQPCERRVPPVHARPDIPALIQEAFSPQRRQSASRTPCLPERLLFPHNSRTFAPKSRHAAKSSQPRERRAAASLHNQASHSKRPPIIRKPFPLSRARFARIV